MNIIQQRTDQGSSPNLPLRSLNSLWAIICSLLIVAFISASGGGASAAQLIWDAGNTNNGLAIDPGSGEWNLDTTTNLNWNNGAENVSWTQTSTTVGINGAVFDGPDATNGTYVVTLDGGQIALTNLVINANGYVFATNPTPASSLFFNTGTTLLVVDGKTVTFSNNFSANNSAKFWQLGNGPVPATMIVNGNIGGDQLVFNSTNGSTFYLGGNTAASVTTIDANVWQTNGTSTGANTWQVGRSVTGSSNNNTGVFVLDGPNTIENFNTSLQISRGGGNGTVICQNGATMNIGTGTAAQNIQIESELSANSHGAFKVTGGTVNIGAIASSTAIGMIWLNKSGSQLGSTAVFTQSGGTVNAWGGILIGASSGTFAGGTSAFTNSGGFLYIGSGGSIGISRGAVFAPTNYFSLSGGTVGALASWISSMPMTLDTLNGNITFQTADSFGDSFNISLSGALTGPGGLYKTGGGTLQLSGANNFAGATIVSNGTLKIVTTLSPANGPVTLDGSAGSPINTVSVASAGQFWTINGDLTYTNGTPTADFNYSTFTPSSTVAPMQVSGNVNFDVAPQVTVEGSAIPTGTYPLIKYGGAVSGVLPIPTSLPSGAGGFIMNNTSSKTISLVVTSSTVTPNLFWRGGSDLWNTNLTNWTQFGAATKYADPDAVVFDDTATGPFPITVTLNVPVAPGSVTALNWTDNGNGSNGGNGGVEEERRRDDTGGKLSGGGTRGGGEQQGGGGKGGVRDRGRGGRKKVRR